MRSNFSLIGSAASQQIQFGNFGLRERKESKLISVATTSENLLDRILAR